MFDNNSHLTLAFLADVQRFMFVNEDAEFWRFLDPQEYHPNVKIKGWLTSYVCVVFIRNTECKYGTSRSSPHWGTLGDYDLT